MIEAQALFDAPAELAAAGLTSGLVIGAFALMGALASRMSIAEALGLRRGTPCPQRRWWVATTAMAAGTVGLSFLLDLALRVLDLRSASALVNFDEAMAEARGSDLALLLVGVALAPALAEELLFRGVILENLLRWTRAGVALVASSVLFGAVHIEPIHAVSAGILGLYLGAIALATRTMAAPILAHAVNNTFAVLTAAFGAEPRAGVELGIAVGIAVAACAYGAAVIARAWREGLVTSRHVVGERVASVERDPEEHGPEQE